ncbi:hypothetical protein CVT26_015290 [Gymnopilus dilepis]|uniref:NB-ARC domain-containing protein n=1 Tax=Gymnopilus dilepis TaxID=231916 RepID=A0A409WA04_9AGAR|nr:hypothetical protein CVT26_015290 [Gymnopilus dilepis]
MSDLGSDILALLTAWQQLIFGSMGAGCIGVGVARLIVTPPGRRVSSSSLPPSLPPALPFYVRGEFILEAVDKILRRSGAKKHIPIRGGPGMGKTATATGIIHHPHIARHFGNARHWVDCRQASDVPDDLKASTLLEFISTSLDVDLTASSDRRKDIKYFLDNNAVPRIIVLDNFESMWEPSTARKASGDVLQFLARFPQVTIILTTRIAHDPATNLGLSWHSFDSIQPLSLDKARELFTELSPDTSMENDSNLDDLLHALDCIPLAIVLATSWAQENATPKELLEKWNRGLTKLHETQLHIDDGDPMEKLDLSISMSLQGPLIQSNSEACVLLRIIAELPAGIRRENLKGIVPWIDDADRVATVLIRTSLLTKSLDVLQMHSTIRSHMRRNYVLGASHKAHVQAFYFQLIHEAGGDPGTRQFLDCASRLSREETNAQALLQDALDDNLVTSVSTAMEFANYHIWNTPSMDTIEKTVELIRNQSLGGKAGSRRMAGQCLFSWWCQHQSLDSLLPLALLRLGMLHFRLDNYPKATLAFEEAVDRYEKLGQLGPAAQARFQLAEIFRLRGRHERALHLYSEAYNQSQAVHDAHGMSACLRGKGIVYFQDNCFSVALEMVMMAQDECSSDDDTCIADCERELGRLYRDKNQTESIRLLTKARNFYLIHGPPRNAAIALYQKSIAQYLQGDYHWAEVGLDDAYQEFKALRNDAQMGFCVFHKAKMNQMRGTYRHALELYSQSESMFQHMENKFMAGLSLDGQAELYAKLCQPGKARQAYSSARGLLKDVDAKEGTATFDILDIGGMCDPSIRLNAIFSCLLCFLPCLILFYLLSRRR